MLRLSKNINFIKELQSFLLIFFPYFLLSMIVYHGTYFQNWLNASYSPPNKFILFLSWSILFALFVLIFHSIKRSNKTNQLCLLLFILQFFSFFVFFISLSCFAAYRFALRPMENFSALAVFLPDNVQKRLYLPTISCGTREQYLYADYLCLAYGRFMEKRS